MRILLIAPDRSVKGGITTVVEGILASDLTEKHEIVHLSSHRDDLTKLGKLWYGLKAYARFGRTVRSFKPDLVHIHSSFGASFFRKAVFIFLSRVWKIKQINHIHGADFDSFYASSGTLKKSIVKWVYRKPEGTIVLSKDWEDKIAAIATPSKVFCLNNFAVLPDIQSNSLIDRYVERDNVVLFLGEVGKRKGAYDIPDIVERVAKRIPDVKFIIAGNGDVDAVSQIVSKKGLDKNVSFKGWIGSDQKKSYLLDARVYLLPSYNEGLPMSILEAMGYGLPIISTFVGGIPELVVPGENGFLYQPGDTAGMADGIIELLNGQQSLALSDNNRRKIERDYSLEVYARKLDHIYAETLGLRTST
jgi:glycosyltransferase involved in cell wall biosynthesis